ncbi:MAG: DUF3618 domain-containing protein [Intrasporangiaceae bacterium]|nr:DUF3618 domain-containing protein [Intrasporangiaceae bacterium]
MSEPSISQLEADIAARRARLADTLGELSYRSQPSVIADRQKRALTAKAEGAAHNAQARFAGATQHEDGSARLEVVGALALAAVVLIAWGVRRHGRR